MSIFEKYFDETKFVKISHCVLLQKKKRESCGQIPDTHTHLYTAPKVFFWVKRVRSERIFSINWAPFFYRQEKNKKNPDSRGAASLGRSPKKRARQPTCTPQWNESLYGVEICLFVWFLSKEGPLWANFQHQLSAFFLPARKE